MVQVPQGVLAGGSPQGDRPAPGRESDSGEGPTRKEKCNSTWRDPC